MSSVVVAPSVKTGRIDSIDVVRGAVMVLMAIDHVRVYSGLPAGGPTAGIFFTRWVTHFCAPVFAFLAGTSAFLYGRNKPVADLSRYLLTRGAWLVLLELTLIRFTWTFNFDYAHYILAGVIWMLGVCMMLMAGIVRLRLRTIAVFGLVVIGAQQIVGVLGQLLPQPIMRVLYFGGAIQLGADGPRFAVLYSIVPWIGVMAAGYAFGAIMVRPAAERRRLCLRIGLGATAAFLVLGGISAATSGGDEDAGPLLFRVLNQQKYPASQLFLLMTLGPAIAVLPFVESTRSIPGVLAMFGRVPFFYYLLHIPVIHATAIVVSLVREGSVNAWLFTNHPMVPGPQPPGYMWSLPLLYLVFFIVIAILYVPCRWFDDRKARPVL